MKFDKNSVYGGDCVEVLKWIPNESVDCVITSPPYDNLRTYSGNQFNYEQVIDAIVPVLKIGGIIVWVIGDATIKGSETGTSFRQALYFLDQGLLLHDTMIYERQAAHPAGRKGNRYTQNFEYMFVFSKGKPKTVNLICDKQNKWAGVKRWGNRNDYQKDDTKKTTIVDKQIQQFSPRNNIWHFLAGSNGSVQQDKSNYHSAAFPYLLAYDHIRTWTNEGDTVLDPMCGSGTTLQAAFN
jgi:DNA modification methylase